mmetsp:Transcript_30701/g.86788  ORF Transcript_30701/g.86788 Transcript_30701/m.86788 type:complete len:977 (-) Transcript_30701:673-3603(-)|eukprot:CAMPEP_0117660938 /NCGR_PEP_ID=MMETSP0804-20121206/7256_1 /TAXON_ID=1074897 /ORGANISM="Tetraselmis astigmatica, Strain CCMP880" /LENGTH=976 /DNA_ID=CAMNT_0005467743 /DNA_START=474 /DNA_END=3404 /DNA_ORIENTATION=+
MADNRLDQIVGEAFSKSACVVLGARLSSQTDGPGGRNQRGRNKWFNLDIPELECVTTDVAPWRRGSIQGPLIVQVILESRREPSGSQASEPEGALLEEWVIDFQSKSPREEADERAAGGVFARRQVAYQDTHTIYKRLVIFHRSLYSYVRVLPAFRIYKALKRHSAAPYEIVSRIVPARSLAEDKQTSSFRFAAVETPKGAFQASVTYQINNPVPGLEEQLQQTYASPQHIIPNYIVRPPTGAGASELKAATASAPAGGRAFCRSRSLIQDREPGLPSSTYGPAQADCSDSDMPKLELVSRSTSLSVQRQPWASNPVQVTSPKWLIAGSGLLGGAGQPSLLPKDTPWSQGLAAVQSNPLLSSPSPRSPFSQPASLPSSTATASSLARTPAASSLPKAVSGCEGSLETTALKPPSAKRVSAPVPAGGLQAGFNPTGPIPSHTVSTSGAPQQAGNPKKGIKLAQGGITAAAEAGQMSPQHYLTTTRATIPGAFTQDSSRPGQMGYTSGPHAGSAGRSSCDMHDRPPAAPGGIGNLSAALRARSSPVCIPGTVNMPRNSSSTQLGGHARRGWRASSCDDSGDEGSPEGDGKGGSARQRPVLSAPAESQHWMQHSASGAGLQASAEPAAGPLDQMGEAAPAGISETGAQDDPGGLRVGAEGADSMAVAVRDLKVTSRVGLQAGQACLEQEPGTSCESSAASMTAASPSGMSCSPQLPFAFTPSSLSCSLLHKTGAALMEAHTLGRHACAGATSSGAAPHLAFARLPTMPSAGGNAGGGGGSNARAVSGRDVSDLALIRRSSWSSRSFSNEAGQLPWLGSFSPGTNLLDNTLQGSSFSGPAMQIFQTLSGGMSPSPTNNLSGLAGGSAASNYENAPEDEDEGLPFALEDYGEDGLLQPQRPSQEQVPSTPMPASVSSGGLLSSATTDAAVGALARMLQEAPIHLRSCGGSSGLEGPGLDAVLSDLENVRQQLECWTEPFNL